MKRSLLIVFFLILFSFLSFTVTADDYEFGLDDDINLFDELYEITKTDDIVNETPNQVKDFLFEHEITPANPFSYESLTSDKALKNILDYIVDYILSPLRSAAILLTVILICGVIGSMGVEGDSQTQNAINIAAALVCTISIALPVTNLINKSVNLITICSGFMISFIPVFAGILIAALRTKTSLGVQPIMFIAAHGSAFLAKNIVAPFSSMYLAVSVAGSVSETQKLKGFSEMIKKVAAWTITAVMTIYMVILSIQTAIVSTSDSASNKLAKFFVSSFVPVIGASLGEALGSMKYCVNILKTSVAIYAVIVILLLLLPLVLEILVWRLLMMFSAAVCQTFQLENIKTIIEAISSALSIILSVVICVGVMFIFSITVVSMAGGSV